MKSKRNLIIAGTFAVGALAGASVFWAARVRAEGIPSPPALTYSGMLENVDGSPATGTKEITIELYDAVTGGTRVCATTQTVELARGRFAIPLEEPCRAGIAAKPDLWAEVKVKDSGSLGRTKLGAVPYAVEAAHAVTATKATNDFTVPGNLTVQGRTTVGIRASTACTYVSAAGYLDCVCAAGETAISGGGYGGSSLSLNESNIVPSGAWRVACVNADGTRVQCTSAFVLCARLQ